MKKCVHIFTTGIFCLLIAIIVIFGLSSLIQKHTGEKLPMTFGWGNAVVLTGSMEPAIPAKSMVIIHDTDSIEKGDVVTYIREDSRWPITHRVTFIDGNTVVTQGDANNAEDAPFHKENILGKIVLIIPPNMIPIIILVGGAFLYMMFTISQKTKQKKDIEKPKEATVYE